jgi:hypothetical protein
MTVSEIAQQDVLLQVLCLICVVEILISQTFQLVVTPNRCAKPIILAMMTAVVHNAIFYIVLNLDKLITPNEINPLFGSYTVWSAIRVFHMFFVMAIIEYLRGRKEYDLWKVVHPEGLLIYLKNRGKHDRKN